MKYKEVFLLKKESFSNVTEKIRKSLQKIGAKEKEIFRTDLLLEETFMRMVENGNAKEVSVEIKKRFGDVFLHLESKSPEYNPLIEVTDFDENDADYYRTLILKANRLKLGYHFHNGKNTITISVHELGNKQIYKTLAGMILGIIFGLLVKEFCSTEILNTLDTDIMKNIRTMFLNALNMMIAPVIFFSVIRGVTSITNTADIGRIGGKLLGFYTATTLIASFLSIGIGYFIFSMEFPPSLFSGAENPVGDVKIEKISVLSMIVEVVPKNLIDPVLDGKMLQIIFVAIIFGICINQLGNKVKILNDFISAMNFFCLQMITKIVSVIPIIAFCSMASLMFKVGMESVFLLGELILGQLSGSLLMIVIYALLIFFVGRISPLPFLKKIISFIPIPLSTNSSNATMPFTMKFCTKKMGVSQKLSSFSIPIGATVNMDGGCFYLSIASIMLAKIYGAELNFEILSTIFLTVVALSIGAPGVPGGAFICLASIVVELGLPTEATAIVLGVDPVCSMLRTALNTTGDIAVTTALAKNEKLMDEKIYLDV